MALQGLTIKFNFNTEDFEVLDELGDQIEQAVSFHNLGSYEGYELSDDGTKGEFYITSPDAEILYKNIRPIVLDSRLLRGSKIETQELTDDGDFIRQINEYQL